MYRGAFEASAADTRARRKAQRQAQSKQTTNARPESQPKAETPKKRSRPKLHTIIFYSVYALCIVAFFIGVNLLMGELDKFLVKYEASQPDVKSRETFAQLFADPDWGALYQMAKVEDTAYDGEESFVSYMEAKVGDQALTFVETSMGLSQDKKFFVRLGDENVASFSLCNVAGAVAIPEWELSAVEVYTSFEESVTVHSYPGYRVSVNGVALDDSHIVRTTQTMAEQYLPEGLHGQRTVSYYLDGLMVTPTVTVTDEAGKEVQLHYDQDTGAYSHDLGAATATQEQTDAFVAASQVYGRFMIADASAATLKKHFTGNSYDAIIQAELAWMQDFSSYEFGEAKITEFYAYSDSFCSARVNQILFVTRPNKTVKEYEINSTFFMNKEADGDWMVVEMTNADVQKGNAQVRLTYMLDGQQVESLMVDANASSLTTPDVAVPEGKVLSGWFRQSVNDEGKTVMTRVFQPDENGTVSLPAGYALEPMVLHALFENEGAE